MRIHTGTIEQVDSLRKKLCRVPLVLLLLACHAVHQATGTTINVGGRAQLTAEGLLLADVSCPAAGRGDSRVPSGILV